ncbi:hypothetical protein AAK938_05720 [Aerococcaceae bacterium 50-4]
MFTINNRFIFIVSWVIQYLLIVGIWYLVVHLLETNPTITNVDRILQVVLSLFSTISSYQAFHSKDANETEEFDTVI